MRCISIFNGTVRGRAGPRPTNLSGVIARRSYLCLISKYLWRLLDAGVLRSGGIFSISHAHPLDARS